MPFRIVKINSNGTKSYYTRQRKWVRDPRKAARFKSEAERKKFNAPKERGRSGSAGRRYNPLGSSARSQIRYERIKKR